MIRTYKETGQGPGSKTPWHLLDSRNESWQNRVQLDARWIQTRAVEVGDGFWAAAQKGDVLKSMKVVFNPNTPV